MSRRLARLALRLYPLAYRRRYGEEMEALLEEGRTGPAAVIDLLRGAIGAHLRPAPAPAAAVPRDERLRRGLGAVLACWLVFAVAGLALYKTTEGSPFEGAAGTPGALGDLHLAIQVLAVLGGVAVVVGAAPFALAALRERRTGTAKERRTGTATERQTGTAKECRTGTATERHAGTATERHTGAGTATGAGARHGSRLAEPSRRAFALAAACAAVVATAMVGIAALTAAYLVTLATNASNLADEPNGPFGTPDVAVSLALQLALMLAVAGPATLAALRTWRTAAPRSS